MKKGDVLELKIEKYAFEGRGIAKISKDDKEETAEKNYVVFVDSSYPGDIVEASLRKIKKNYSVAKTVNVISPSPDRVMPRCPYFGTCGGCKQQDLNYSVQLTYKQLQVNEIFKKMGGISGFRTEPIIPSDNLFYYRNKMEFSFADKRWLTEEEIRSGENIDRSFALGLHIPGAYDKVLDITECHLQSELSTRILNFTREFFKATGTEIYSTKTHTGYLRNLVIRQSSHTSELMVNIVTAHENDDLITEYTKRLRSEFPEITTVVNNINLKKASVAAGDYEKIFFGSGYIYEKIGNYKFRVSANSFFQTNSLQAEKLYNTALEYAELTGNETVYDLYSGAGTISIYVSGHAREVYAFESVSSAVTDAKVNAEENNAGNVHFFEADLYKSFMPVVESSRIPSPDVIIVDPPRSGMHMNTVEDLLKLNASRIVYVSCNPTTQVRDITGLLKGGYELVKMRPVDMFPHTFHIENVALLIK